MNDASPASIVRGEAPMALTEDVSLATPLTLGRVTGREAVVQLLAEMAAAFGIEDAEFVAEGDDRTVVTFIGQGQGQQVGVLGVLTTNGAGSFKAVDLYARPWPFVAYVREKLATESELVRTDVDLSSPYLSSGPTDGYLDGPAPSLTLAADVQFHSPVLTATAVGRDLVGQVLQVVAEVSGEPKYRVVDVHGESIVALYDSHVHGHVWQIAGVLTANQQGEITDMRLYSRPWPITALFRGEAYKLLRNTLGDEFWQGEPPLAALGGDG
jgi:hypothetical protein